jgi:hypothetical protein
LMNFGHKYWAALVRLCCHIRDNKDLGQYFPVAIRLWLSKDTAMQTGMVSPTLI